MIVEASKCGSRFELAGKEISMSAFSGKVVVVTGASKGIGAAIAKAFGAAGASVVVNYATSKSDADRVVAEIEKGGAKAIAVQADVSKASDVERLFRATKEAFDGLDVLVNNAGVYAFVPIEASGEAEFRRMFDTNVLGTILATREAVKHFGAKGGAVINVGSTVTTLALPSSAIYTATKGAIDAVTRVLAKELAPKKIRVNSINPGAVETEGARELMGSDFAKSIVSQTPLGRIGQPGDIAPVALFLASPEAAWITGELVVASGGLR
jgi:3-oxoacyl-[acyl-carrier protein] reductase